MVLEMKPMYTRQSFQQVMCISGPAPTGYCPTDLRVKNMDLVSVTLVQTWVYYIGVLIIMLTTLY